MSAPAVRVGAPWGVSAASLLATLVAAGSLRTLVQGDAWWWAALLVSCAAVAAAAGVRSVRRVRALAPIAGTVVAAVAALMLWVPGSLVLLVLPTGRTLPALEQLIRSAMRQIYLDSPPATSTPGLQLMIALGVALLAVVVDSLAAELRLPWLAGLPLLLLAIVPARSVGVGDDLAGATATVLAFLLVVWLDRRRDLSRPPAGAAAALAATAVAGALIVQALVPALVAPTTASAGPLRPVFAPGADPLVRLGEELHRGADVSVLTYRTDATAPVYLRVVTIEDLTGDEWAPTTSEGGSASNRQVQRFPAPQGLSPGVNREKITTQIKDSYQQRSWMPVPYAATSIAGLVGAWAWEPESLTVQAVGRTEAVPEYTVKSLQIQPTEEQLRTAPAISQAQFSRYLALPNNRPAVIGQTARQVTAGAPSAYDQAMALQDYLRGPGFTYDESTPQRANGNGDSLDVVAAFLDKKRGYCVHFAAAMTVMARELGIPARIAVGYQPGERRINDPGVFEVTSHDLHSWPELYFEGVGWTRFEPTPGRGDVPRYHAGAAATAGAASTAPTPTPSASTRQDRSQQDTAAGGGGSAGGPPLGAAAVGGGILVLLALPGVLRALRRRRRLAALPRRVGPAWDEVQDTALDLGLVDTSVSTPRGLAERLDEVLPSTAQERAELLRLRAGVEREWFARPGSAGDPPEADAVRRLLRRMLRSTSRRVRLRAALAPRSLLVRLGRLPWARSGPVAPLPGGPRDIGRQVL